MDYDIIPLKMIISLNDNAEIVCFSSIHDLLLNLLAIRWCVCCCFFERKFHIRNYTVCMCVSDECFCIYVYVCVYLNFVVNKLAQQFDTRKTSSLQHMYATRVEVESSKVITYSVNLFSVFVYFTTQKSIYFTYFNLMCSIFKIKSKSIGNTFRSLSDSNYDCKKNHSSEAVY